MKLQHNVKQFAEKRSFAFDAPPPEQCGRALLTVKRRATCLAYNVAYDCFCVNNDSISLRLTDGWWRRCGVEKRFPCLWQFFATFLFAQEVSGGGVAHKSFLISYKSKGVNNAARRLDST